MCIAGLQNGSETVCHGVDALNTETKEVIAELSARFVALASVVYL